MDGHLTERFKNEYKLEKIFVVVFVDNRSLFDVYWRSKA
jgi:hypothetical protein